MKGSYNMSHMAKQITKSWALNTSRYTLFKYPPLLEFANMFNYTAMGLGNHDFDDGIPGLVPFIQQANFAVLAANIDAALEPSLVSELLKIR